LAMMKLIARVTTGKRKGGICMYCPNELAI
jgi:hypothetical protein